MIKSATKFSLILILVLPLVLTAAQKGFRFDTPWLGVMVKDLSEKTLKNMDLDYGVQIAKVYKDSPADKAGLEIDDIIISFSGENIEKSDDLIDKVKDSKTGDEVSIEYLRDGKRNSTTAVIEKRKVPHVYMKSKPKILKKDFHHYSRSVFLGVKVEQLTDQLREYFGVDEDFGVLISEIIEDSPADKAGLKAGDIIIQVAEREVKCYRDLIRGLNYFDPGDKVDIKIVRNKSNKTVNVKLGEPENDHSQFRWFGDDMNFYDYDVTVPEMDIEIPEIEDLEEEEIRLKLEGDPHKRIRIHKEIIKENEAFLQKPVKRFS